jgi:putative PIN family toxin of toxin-antitoxin system
VITAVLDANVLASGFVHPVPAPGQLIAAWLAKRYTLAQSDHLLAELARTFARAYFTLRLTANERRDNVALVRDEATIVAVSVSVRGVATHPEDDVVLATAVSAGADYLVTGDLKLQRLGAFQGVRIVSPRAFLAVLEHEPPA